MAVKIPWDAIATIPLVFKDAVGDPVTADTTNITAVSTDATIAVVNVTPDGNSLVITPLLRTGASTATYTDNSETPPIVITVDYSIVNPVPATGTADEANMVLTANPTPPTA